MKRNGVKQKRPKKMSLKWKVFAYLLSLAAVILAVLWLCQTVYLEKFYKYIKERDLKESVELLTQVLKLDDPADKIKEIAQENALCLLVVDPEGERLYAEQFDPVSAIDGLSKEQLLMYYAEVKQQGGVVEIQPEDFKDKNMLLKEKKKDDFEKREQWKFDTKAVSREAAEGNPPDSQFSLGRPIEEQLLTYRHGGQESMVYAKILSVNGEEAMLLVTIKLTPVEATIQTLRFQLILISVIIILLSLVLAFTISRSISKSIIRVNASAAELAKGNLDVIFDGTDYREIEQLSNTLNYAAAELAKTENFQRELLANVSHDLRTPLTMIIAYAEVMRDLPGENTPENIQVVIEEAQRLTNLVNDMLDISKLQAGVMQMERKEYDLTDSIHRVMERYVKLKEQEQYQILFEYDENVRVDADEYKIYQVLYNLINNAINYTGEDKKVVVRQLVRGGRVRIEVQDTGEGIPKEELGNVWERYYKVDKVHKRALQGTGLGLSICRNILKLHGAQFGVESEPGSGSVFWFELPCIHAGTTTPI